MSPTSRAERDAQIAQLMRAGEHSLQSIGNMFGMTRENVRRIVSQQGISERHGHSLRSAQRRSEREAKLAVPDAIADYRAGLSQDAVAKKHGVTRTLITRVLKDTGVERRKYSAREFGETTKRVIELSRDGIGPSEIAAQLGVTVTLVSVIRRRRNLVNRDNDLRRHSEMSYPYLRRAEDDPTGLLAIINRLVPPQVPHFIRADVCQDLVLAILEGTLQPGDLKASVPKALARVRKMHPFMFAPLSLDREIPGTNGLRMIDTIADDRIHF